MLIAANFDSVPDVVVPTKAGLYVQTVKAADPKDKKDKDGNVVGQQVQIILINESGPNGEDIGLEKGKTLFSFIDTNDFTALKRMALSAGMTKESISQGIDLALLVGRRVKTLVTNSVGTGQNAGKTFANVRDFIIPGEPNPQVK